MPTSCEVHLWDWFCPTDFQHCMLVDLRTKFPDLTGKVAEKVLVEADITANKNMVPFD